MINLNQYRVVFNLPTLTSEHKATGSFFLRYCNSSPVFIVLVVINKKNEFLVVPASNLSTDWQLLGRHVNEGESVQNVIDDLLHRNGLNKCLLHPLAVSKQKYIWEDKTIVHEGLVLLVRSISDVTNIGGIFTSDVPDLPYQNNRFIALARENIKQTVNEIPYHEVTSFNKANFRYFIHKHLVKPIMRGSSNKILHKTLDLVKSLSPSTILDISCGEDSTLKYLSKSLNLELCVANDISLCSLSPLFANMVSSNQSILDAKFGLYFDLVLCKNTLHHIPAEAQQDVIDKLLTLGEHVLVIDILNPRMCDWKSKMWNCYYRLFLEDQGHDFLDLNSFGKLIDRYNIIVENRGVIKTSRGKYMYALIKLRK